VHSLPGGQLMHLRPILCVDDVERTNPSQTLAGQVGIDVHGYLRGLPRQEEAPQQHYQRSPNDRFSAHIRSLAREIGQRRVGLALSSGGAKALAHIGVIQVLEENNIDVDVVAGASMGGYIGAMWCFGLNGHQMEQIALKLEASLVLLKLIDFSFTPRRGFMKGGRVRRLLEEAIGQTHFSDLSRTLRVVATDLDTLDRVVFDSGPVAPAVQASMAMPGVMVPVVLDGRHMIDGGAADPLPVDVLQEMGVDHIIAVNTIPNPDELKTYRNITEEYIKAKENNILPAALDKYVNYFHAGNILDTFTRSMHAAETRVAEASCRKADVVLRAVSNDGKWHDFRNPRKYIGIGRHVAEMHLEELRALVRVKP
jgi:NTE family protein